MTKSEWFIKDADSDNLTQIFSEEDFKSKLEDCRKNPKNQIQNEYQEKPDFAYSLKSDDEKLTLEFSSFSQDEKSDDLKEEKYLFDIKNGFTATSTWIDSAEESVKNWEEPSEEKEENDDSGEMAPRTRVALMSCAFIPSFNRNHTGKQIPKAILRRIYDVVTDYARRFTGKNLKFFDFDEIRDFGYFLDEVVHIPFCPRLSSAILHPSFNSTFEEIARKFPIDRKDEKILDKFISYAKIPDSPKIREIFENDYAVLEVAYYLEKAGFTEIETINLAAEDEKFVSEVFDLTEPTDEVADALAFFLKLSVSAGKTQTETLKTLLKIEDDENSWGSWRESLKKFRENYDSLSDDFKKKTIANGFTKKNCAELLKE